jgi:hypothetical protein
MMITMVLLVPLLTAQTVKMGPATPPLEPEMASVLDKWTDNELYAYENGLIEGVWIAARVFFEAGDTRSAYAALSVLDAYWWQISQPAGMRGAMRFIRAMYSKARERLMDIPLYELVLMQAGELERMTR